MASHSNNTSHVHMNHTFPSKGHYGRVQISMDESAIVGWSTAFLIESILIVIGNAITISTFLNVRLRQNRTFYFLINLALADFVVGFVNIPIFLYVFINYFRGVRIDIEIYIAHRVLEVFTEYLAIFSLALVSLERMYAVVWPLKHRRTAFYKYIICIIITWALAGLVPSLDYVPLPEFKKTAFILFFILFTAALLVICISYMVVWSWITCLRPTVINRHHEADRRLARTLVLVTVVSLVAWLPFQLINYVTNLCKTCQQIPVVIVYLTKLLHYGNSLVNPILYCFRIPDFYQTTRSILGLSSDRHGGRDSMELRQQENGEETRHVLGNSVCSSYNTRVDDYKSMESCLG